MGRHRKRIGNGTSGPSTLSGAVRSALARTAAARASIDASIAGVVVEGDPPQLGARRDRDLNDVRAIYRRRFEDDWMTTCAVYQRRADRYPRHQSVTETADAE